MTEKFVEILNEHIKVVIGCTRLDGCKKTFKWICFAKFLLNVFERLLRPRVLKYFCFPRIVSKRESIRQSTRIWLFYVPSFKIRYHYSLLQTICWWFEYKPLEVSTFRANIINAHTFRVNAVEMSENVTENENRTLFRKTCEEYN